MSRLRCNACLGEYDDVSADGIAYTHACPPLTRATVKRGGNWIAADLGAVLPTDTVKVVRGRVMVETLVTDVQPDDVRVGDVQVTRPPEDHRDENVTAAPPVSSGGSTPSRRPIKSVGKGATKIG